MIRRSFVYCAVDAGALAADLHFQSEIQDEGS